MTQETPVDVTLEPGFYWVLPVFDVDSDADSWRQHEQPAYWDGERWAMLDTEDWAVRWVGSRIASTRPTQADAVSVERVARAICQAIIDQDDPDINVVLPADLTVSYLDQGEVDFGKVAKAALTAMNTSRDAEVIAWLRKQADGFDPRIKEGLILSFTYMSAANAIERGEHRQALAEGD